MRMMPATPITSPEETGRIPTVIVPGRTPSPTPRRAESPIPPQRIADRRECIGIITVIEHIPLPRRKGINYIPIEGAAQRYGKTRITETDNPHGIFIIALRTFEAIHPFTPFVQRLFFNVQSIILHRESIVTGSIPTIVLIDITHIAVHILHHHRRTRRGIDSCRSLRCINHHLGRCSGNHLLFLFRLLLGDEIKVVVRILCQQQEGQTSHHQRNQYKLFHTRILINSYLSYYYDTKVRKKKHIKEGKSLIFVRDFPQNAPNCPYFAYLCPKTEQKSHL